MSPTLIGRGARRRSRTRSAAWMSIPRPRNTRPITQGEAFHFCSDGCKAKFEADPARYLADKPEPHAETGPKSAADERAIFTCPMHPEVRQVGPGSCPICGMALEPLEVGVDAGPNPELADMTRRFWIGLALAIPVFTLEMGGHLFRRGPSSGFASAYRPGFSSCWRRRWCCGRAGRSSNAAGARSSRAISTCSR